MKAKINLMFQLVHCFFPMRFTNSKPNHNRLWVNFLWVYSSILFWIPKQVSDLCEHLHVQMFSMFTHQPMGQTGFMILISELFMSLKDQTQNRSNQISSLSHLAFPALRREVSTYTQHSLFCMFSSSFLAQMSHVNHRNPLALTVPDCIKLFWQISGFSIQLTQKSHTVFMTDELKQFLL